MNSKELVERLINILTEAADRRVAVYKVDEHGNVEITGYRIPDLGETLKFITDRLYAIKDEIETSENIAQDLEDIK